MERADPDQTPLLRRCAWCGRAFVDGEWREVEDDVVAHLLARVTDTVCPDCVERLRDEGLSE